MITVNKATKTTFEIEVFGIGAAYVGTAGSFGEAKRMQQDSLPDDLKPAYAGIQDGGPLFYAEMLTPELLAKYPALDPHRNPDP